MMFLLNCVILMNVLLRLSFHIEILIIGNIRLFLRNLESLNNCFVSSLCSCDPLACSDNERAKQLMYALNDSVWGYKNNCFRRIC
jgi:hypothetical protein